MCFTLFAANVREKPVLISELFCIVHLANIECFLCHSNLSFQFLNFCQPNIIFLSAYKLLIHFHRMSAFVSLESMSNRTKVWVGNNGKNITMQQMNLSSIRLYRLSSFTFGKNSVKHPVCKWISSICRRTTFSGIIIESHFFIVDLFSQNKIAKDGQYCIIQYTLVFTKSHVLRQQFVNPEFVSKEGKIIANMHCCIFGISLRQCF